MKLSAVLDDLKLQAQSRELVVQDLLDALGLKGHSVLIVVFTIPFLQPIPTFGLSAPFGLSIALIGFSLAFGLKPWLPERFRKLKMNQQVAIKSIDVAETIFVKIERIIKPRFYVLISSKPVICVTGLLIFVHGVLMALPLPIPGTNSAPAWCLLVLALAQVEEDGYLILLGYFLTALSFAFFALLVFLPMYGVEFFSK